MQRRCDNLPEPVVHLVRRAHCLYDLAPNSARELLSQAVDQRLHRAETEIHAVGHFLITCVRFHSSEKRRQRFKEIRLAFRGAFYADLVERALQDRRPPRSGIEDFIRRRFTIRAQVVQLLGLELVCRDELHPAAAFQGMLLHVLVRQTALQRSEEETAEAPPFSRSALERLVFQKVLKK